MADTTQFSGFPYYDDYSDEKKFIKMLFKPGFALQARELTQIQTILQKQISRFANHMFKDGSPVVDGQLAVLDANFIRVNPTVTVGTTTSDVIHTQFIGKTITNIVGSSGTPQIRMKVLHAEAVTEADPYVVLFVQYLDTVTVVNPVSGELENKSTLQEIYNYNSSDPKPNITLAVLSVVDETNQEVATDIRCTVKTDSPEVETFGKATLVANKDGIYYIDGSFILATPQCIALKRLARRQSDVLGETFGTGIPNPVENEWSSAPGENPRTGSGWSFNINTPVGTRLYQYPSSRVGFTINRQIIDADADTTLLDPAYGSYNYAAPGADRHKVDLVLDQLQFTNLDSLSDSEQYKTNNFVELTRVVDGILKYSIKYPLYSDLEDTLARRTYDESGSYTVKPFEIDIQEYFNNEKICIFRETPYEVFSTDQNALPFSMVGQESTTFIDSGFPTNYSVYGFRVLDSSLPETEWQWVLSWKGIVSNPDTFLARQGELDFRNPERYGTTLLYIVYGNPSEGDIVISESYSKSGSTNRFFLKSQIPFLDDVKDQLYTDIEGMPIYVLPQTGGNPVEYQTAFPHVSTISDTQFNGKYTLGRLYPEWSATATDPTTTEVLAAIDDAKSKLSVGVGPGKAYIFGYEFENQNTKYLSIDKARETQSVEGENVNFGIGNYVICAAITGADATIPATVRVPSFSALPEIELWDTLGTSDVTGGLTGNELGLSIVGKARIRGATPTEDGNINVYLCDVRVNDGKFFSDFDQIRYRYSNVADDPAITGNEFAGTLPLFNISITGGSSGTGGVVKTEIFDASGVLIGYYVDTVLFAPKNNLAIFDLPSLCSLQEITKFAPVKYDCKKTFSKQMVGNTANTTGLGLQFRTYGTGVSILSNRSTSAGVAANIPDTSPQAVGANTLYTFKTGSGSGGTIAATLATALGGSGYLEVDATSLRNLAIFNANSGVYYNLADTTRFQVGMDSDKKTLYVVTNDATLVGPEFILESVMSVQAETGDKIDFRKKQATTINEYETNVDWAKYFNEDGYFMVPLQNWNGIFQFNPAAGNIDPYNVQYDPVADNGWDQLWTGDDDEDITGNTNSFLGVNLPDEYATILGFPDVISVDEVVVWDSSENTPGNSNGKRDITEYFELVNGANDNFYDHAKIVIKKKALKELKALYPGIFRNRGNVLDYTLFVRFKFFKHSGSGPFTINSYEHNDHHPFFTRYEDIPLYTSPIFGTTFELRNCIDYRPSREISSPAKVAVALADSVDFSVSTSNRPQAYDLDCPIRDNSFIDSSTGAFITPAARADSESVLPALGPNVVNKPAVSYSYYTSRTDKLILRKNRKFEIVRGKAGIRPESPNDIPESMSLYTLTVPQYTFGPEDVFVNYIDNKRYTMSDIGKLEKRIERVEYYTTLSLLEKEAADLTIPDPTLGGAERLKNGIFVDNFKGHGVGDVFNPYYSCSMDFEKGHLRPRFKTRNVIMVPQPTADQLTKFSISPDGIITLKYDDNDPSRYIVQPLASRAISVNPFDVVSWLGSISLAPSTDTWIDTKRNPSVTVNLEGENDAWQGMQDAFGTQWNDWETTWSGVVSSTSERLSERVRSGFLDAPHSRRAPDGVMRRRRGTTTTRTNLVTETIDRKETREGIKTIINPQRVTKDIGDRIVDVSIVPYIRERIITITGKALKPNTILHAFFDNTLVDKYCYDSEGDPITSANPIKTNSAGEVEVSFHMPGGVFKTGERQFRLTDDPSNNITNSTTSAESNYFAQGLLQVKENTVVSTRVPVITRQSVTEERVVRDVVTRVQTETNQTNIRWVDPLAQTFLVDTSKNPKGIWIHSVDLFFKNKPTSNIPVRVQIRPTVNGYPHSSMVIPFAEVFLTPDQVNTSLALASDGSDAPNIANSATYTRFKFSSPVYLVPGEYSIVVMSNSNEYECYIAEMGANVLGGGSRITQQPYAGVFFKSQNASTWSADQNSDLMFCINSCEFITGSGEVELDFAASSSPTEGMGPAPDAFDADAMKVLCQYLRFDGTDLNAYLTSGTSTVEIPLNENFAPRPTSVHWTTSTKVKLGFSSTDPTLSPCVDSERFSVVLVDNQIGSPDDQENYPEEYEPRPTDIDERIVSRYISRRVDLISGLECDDLKVYLNANLPNYTYINSGDGSQVQVKTKVEVWARLQTPDSDIPFDDTPWMKMEPNPLQETIVATDEVAFNEYSFTLPETYYPNAPSNIPPTGYKKFEQAMAAPFSRYAIKIVLYSNTGTIVPKVKDLRVIAVV